VRPSRHHRHPAGGTARGTSRSAGGVGAPAALGPAGGHCATGWLVRWGVPAGGSPQETSISRPDLPPFRCPRPRRNSHRRRRARSIGRGRKRPRPACGKVQVLRCPAWRAHGPHPMQGRTHVRRQSSAPVPAALPAPRIHHGVPRPLPTRAPHLLDPAPGETPPATIGLATCRRSGLPRLGRGPRFRSPRRRRVTAHERGLPGRGGPGATWCGSPADPTTSTVDITSGNWAGTVTTSRPVRRGALRHVVTVAASTNSPGMSPSSAPAMTRNRLHVVILAGGQQVATTTTEVEQARFRLPDTVATARPLNDTCGRLDRERPTASGMGMRGAHVCCSCSRCPAFRRPRPVRRVIARWSN